MGSMIATTAPSLLRVDAGSRLDGVAVLIHRDGGIERRLRRCGPGLLAPPLGVAPSQPPRRTLPAGGAPEHEGQGVDLGPRARACERIKKVGIDLCRRIALPEP